jgi:acyl-CoA reductase-like NAD-dependent aldehyde dehydrogenase
MDRFKKDLFELINRLKEIELYSPFVDAYLQDTAFTRKEIYRREVLTPVKLLEVILNSNTEKRRPLGKVAIVVPKNALGIPMAKAVAASHLMGNETLLRLPRQLSRAEPIYRNLLSESLKGIEFSPPTQSAKDFLIECLKAPDIKAIVVYGDEVWIDEYYPLARQTQTKFIFEGPGNDPLIVLPDADLDEAVEGAITCGLNNGGQSCSALERFFVHHAIAEDFTVLLLKRLSQLKLGSPDDLEVDIGPIASSNLVGRIQRQIQDAVDRGAKLLKGGSTIEGIFQGLPILEPTVLSRCTTQMSVVRDETFGPVFPLLWFDETDLLIAMVDDTRYGLNASVYGTCPPELRFYLEKTHRNVFFNSTAVSPENRSQLWIDGGYKRSGFIWEQTAQGYTHREGRRYLTQELSQAD